MNLKKPFQSLSDKTLNIIRNLDSNSTICVDGFLEDEPKAIVINNPYYKKGLYCVELTGSGNLENHLGSLELENLHRNFKHKKDGFLIWALVKKGNFQKNYVFSYSKSMLEFIADYYGCELIDGIELLNVLYDLQLDNQYVVDKEKKCLNRKLDLTQDLDYEFINYQYNNIVQDSVYENLSKFNVYQATHFKRSEKATNISRLFNLDFSGIIYTYISFNKLTAVDTIGNWLCNAKNAMTGEKRKLEIFKEEISSGDTLAVTMNSVLMIDKKDDSDFLNATIGDCLNAVFQKDKEGRSARKNLIKYTPIRERNPLWNKVLPLEYAENYIASTHKEPSPNPHMFGKDINGAFTSYNLRQTTPRKSNTRPHFFVGGKTGSSKTTFVNAMISQMIQYDWDKEKIGNYTGIKIRQFDIKDSLGPFARHVNRYNKGSVAIIETNLNDFSYNLLNIGTDEDGMLDENDISFCKSTTSFILYSKDKTQNAGLTFDEDSLYGEIINRVYAERLWEDITIEELSLYQKELAQELVELGYTFDHLLSDITQEEYSFLQKPTISAVLRELDRLASDKPIEDDELQLRTVQSLRKKIKVVASFGAKHHTKSGLKISGYFDRYEKTNIDSSKQWLLFNMDRIKELDEYAPIQWILLNKIVHEDKKNQLKLRKEGKEEPLIIYYIEEAHNMFNNPLFKSTEEKEGILDKPALEWRSYNIVLAPISQKSEHIPKGVYDSIETKFFLFPPKADDDEGGGEREKEIETIVSLLSLSEKARRLLQETPLYHACAVNEHGSFVIGLETTEYMRKVFDGKMVYN